MAITYNWTNVFNLRNALAGTLVGFEQSNDYDLSMTGTLKGVGPLYELAIGGYSLKVNAQGVVKEVVPPKAEWLNQTLQMVTTDMGSEASVGSAVTRSSGSSGTGRSATAVLTTMEPRDHFAMSVLSAMLVHMEKPEAKDDATMIRYSRAAYRWAQAMMIAAADSRDGTSTGQSSQVNVNSNDLQSNTEKVLYNINESLKGIKTQVQTSLSGTLKIDNPQDDTFEIEGGGSGGGQSGTEAILTTMNQTLLGIKTQIQTSLSGTLKVDNPTNDTFEVEGGGGSSLSRDDVNDTGQNITDFMVYNSGAGNDVVRATLSNVITKILSSANNTQKQLLYDAIKSKMQADFDAKGSATTALADAKTYADDKAATALADAKTYAKGYAEYQAATAKSYTDSEIAKKHPST